MPWHRSDGEPANPQSSQLVTLRALEDERYETASKSIRMKIVPAGVGP